MGNAGGSNSGQYREMKLCSEVLESSSNLTEVPSYVKVKQIDSAAGSVIAIHHDKASSQFFFICDNGYFAVAVNSSTGAESVLDVKPYTSFDENATGSFMGFQPSLNADTFLLLQDRGVFPIQFGPNGLISLHPTRNAIRSDNNNSPGSMWAVREFAPNQIAIGFFNQQNIEIYEGETLKRRVNVGMSIFGFVVPPNLT